MNSTINVVKKALLFSTILLSATSCYINTISPEPGRITTEVRNTSTFTGLDIESGIRVTVTAGNTEKVEIEAREGYQPYILTEVRNNTLRVYIDRRLNNRRGSDIQAFITMRTLDYVSASGGSRVTTSDMFRPDRFDVSLSGGSYLRVPITTNTITVDASGGSEASISGSAQRINADELSGGSRLLAADLRVNYCTIDASGGSTADVNVSDELNVRASGGSIVRYKGSPRITQSVSGGSRVTPL